jgi:D-lactate dehydrogenase
MLIEDVACPVNKLADMTLDLVEMFKKFGYKDASCFGHALEGNLHLVFSQVSSFCRQTAALSCCFLMVT